MAPPTGSGSYDGCDCVLVFAMHIVVAIASENTRTASLAKGSLSPEATRPSNRWLVNARARS